MGSNVNLEEYAIKFLLYSYFKLTLNSDPESILNSIVERAYQDATMQGAYNAKLSNLWGKKSTLVNKETIKKEMLDLSAKAKQKSFEPLKNFVNELPSKDNYNIEHGNLCKEILTAYNDVNNKYNEYRRQCGHAVDNNIFTYGNAQKWVNMTMKYVLIIYAIFSKYNKHLFPNIKNTVSSLHVPIDSYIIDVIKLPNTVKTWSNWDEKTYIEVQGYIKKKSDDAGNDPIIWEGDAWIEQAIKRNKAPKKSTSIKKPQD